MIERDGMCLSFVATDMSTVNISQPIYLLGYSQDVSDVVVRSPTRVRHFSSLHCNHTGPGIH